MWSRECFYLRYFLALKAGIVFFLFRDFAAWPGHDPADTTPPLAELAAPALSPFAPTCSPITNETVVPFEFTDRTHYTADVTHILPGHIGGDDCILCVVVPGRHTPTCMGNPLVMRRGGSMHHRTVRLPHTCTHPIQFNIYDRVDVGYLEIMPNGTVARPKTKTIETDKTGVVIQVAMAILFGEVVCEGWVYKLPPSGGYPARGGGEEL